MFARSGEVGRARRPHLVIAHSDSTYAAGISRAFRRYGWVVVQAADGAETRRLASSLAAEMVVLQADLPEESGWLTCAKLNVGGNHPNVVLVAGDEDQRDDEFAEFVGAVRLVTRDEGAEPLLQEAGLAMPVSQVV